MGSDDTPREPHQDSFAERNGANATSIEIPQQVYIHGYVMGSQPPQGPPRVYDILDLEGQKQTQAFSNSPYQYGSSNPAATPRAQPGRPARIIVTVGYILAWFFFLPHMLSIAGSLHLYKKGLLGAHRTAVLVCSYLEIAAFCLCAVASWSFADLSNPWSHYEYSSDDIYSPGWLWFGWIYMIVWVISLLAAGIPRLIFSVQKPKAASVQLDEVLDEASAAKYRRCVLILYVIGIFFPPLLIASIACSLYLLNRGQIVSYKARVMALVALELCGWIIGASLSWFVMQECTSWYWSSCETVWLGYIFICIQFSFAVACGIPRVVFTFKGKRSAN